MSHDRVDVDEFLINHEFLGQMLGSRRATVTLSAGVLQAAGLIKYHRGIITIVDRSGLEEVSCECYAVIKAELDSVLRKAAARAASERTRKEQVPAGEPPRGATSHLARPRC
ncbi:MAG: winged helix-turn-helix domain-containing protein [Candidatus Dormibacteraeota bacterium]|uniref:Winged helix-turn-helix domain-containing protein n=2 Tax=Candidatus Aeolococcus gillhamiae TaxID=3127015 RepID=A0A934N983_9BACT|nr:winged helix-turn-helix domain-containing protein [Candidatus Dormibacteraeota bacterium]